MAAPSISRSRSLTNGGGSASISIPDGLIGGGVVPVSISGTPGAATVGTPYIFTPSTSNGSGAKSFTMSGSLPAGLSFSSATGAITGTPTTQQQVDGIGISVSDASGSASLNGLSIVVSAASSTGPYLPTLSFAPTMAFGAKRMVSGYNGSLFRLRRADGIEQDFAASGGDLPSYSAINTFANGAALTVSAVYAQDGSGKVLGQADPASQPSFDTSQLLAGCSPILFDGQRSAVGGPAAKWLSVGGLAVERTNITIADVLAPQVSLQDNVHYAFTDSTFVQNYLAAYTIATAPGLTVRPGGGVPAFDPATSMPRVNPSVIITTTTTSGRAVNVRENRLTAAAAVTSQVMTDLLLGRFVGSLASGSVSTFNSRIRRWGFAVYPALSAADELTLRQSLEAMFSIPTTFTGRLVIDGDSITEGSGVALLNNIPSQLSLPSTERFNIAIHGQTGANAYAARSSRRDVLYTSAYGAGKCIFSLAIGINDITADTTGANLYANSLSPYVTSAKALGSGARAGIATILPWNNGNYTSGRNTERQAANSNVLANTAGADFVIDIANDAVMGGAAGPGGAGDNTTLYPDKLHPSAAGDLRLATAQYRPAYVAAGLT